jgi:hypothetical protein
MARKKRQQLKDHVTPFERFQRLIRGLVAVPKKEIAIEEERWRANRLEKKKNVDV